MDVRKLYLDFFANKGHKIYDSMPLVPDDASLLFTNAGMVQFKDIFTGKVPIPTPPRATSSQLCIRAGGKHNDLENVGYTARHHTLFEMLGNFSFGNYFKKEAIAFAWEFVTEVLQFDKALLYVTIHESDDEAYELWCEHISPDRIKRMGDKDNFWQMGDSGPCGPCSEIYVDQGEKYFHTNEDYFGGEGDRFLEIWNLVFMQFEQRDGKRYALPKPSIDTGMGLERVIALKEGKINNFDTSLFASLMQCIENLTNKKYYCDNEVLDNEMGFSNEEIQEIKSIQASFRVIADHARSVTFLLAQGVNFDKEGRGYVLRRILRRAVRHGYLLGLKQAFLYKVVGAVCESMGTHYNYLNERKNAIMQQCRNEEERFFETLEMGMELFNKELTKLLTNNGASTLLFSGEVAFKLYDTYGFPLDLTQDMLRDRNIEVDLLQFEKYMNEQKLRSKASWKGSGDMLKEGDFKELLDSIGMNEFIGYESMQSESKILALLDSNLKCVDFLPQDSEGYIMLDKTPFYPESGGPIGDKGLLFASSSQINPNDTQAIALVLDTKKYFGLNLSFIQTKQTIKVGDNLFAKVDKSRLEIVKHHSATHLLHLALRTILGSHITQAGSLVESNRLRFDFSHPKALSTEEILQIQDYVNDKIVAGSYQKCEILPLDEAKSRGAMALFGEKYDENVRVISFDDSMELCGGIHVENTANIGSFYIVKESGVSSGVRRIEAVCGKAGYEYGKSALCNLERAKEILKAQDVIAGITKLKDNLSEMKSKLTKAKTSIKNLDYEEINDIRLIVLKLDSIDNNEAKEAIDRAKNENEKVAILLITQQDSKLAITAGVKNVSLKANEWIKHVAIVVGGNGGGREDFATAGGKDINKIDEALQKAKEFAKEKLS